MPANGGPRLCAALALLLLATGPALAETTLERVQQTGTVRIGYANEAPFAYTTLDGKITGESPEIARVIFAKLGVEKVKGVLTEWGSLIPGLRAGRRSEEHTSELQSLMRISYAVFCLKKQKKQY